MRSLSASESRYARYTIFVLIFVAMALGAGQVTVTRDVSEAMLPQEGRAFEEYQKYLATFPSDNGAIIVFLNLLCSEQGWDLILQAERIVSNLPIVERTISLASPNTKYIDASEGIVKFGAFKDVDFADATARCAAASSYKPYLNLIVASGGAATALHVIAKSNVDASEFTATLQDRLAPLTEQAIAFQGRVLITGEPVMSAALGRILARDSVYIIVTVGVMLLLTALATRTARTAVASAILMLFVLSTAYGVLGWLGLDLTATSSLAIFLLAPLSGAFVIHAHGYMSRDDGSDTYPPGATLAFVVAGLSTAIGFACTGLTPAPDVQRLALTGIVGIAGTTVGSLLFVFPFLRGTQGQGFSIQFAVPRWIFVHPQMGYALVCFLLISICFGLSRTKFEYRPTDYLPMSNPTRAEFEEVGSWFGRMSIPIVINVENTSDPTVWKKAKPLVDLLMRREAGSIYTSWLYDQMSILTRAFATEQSESLLDFPDSTRLFEQLILLYDPSDLDFFINEDRNKILLRLHVPFLGSNEYFELRHQVQSHFREHNLDGHIVGRASAFFETGHRIGPDNLQGLAVGGGTIFLILLGIFRSFTFALIGIFTNALPVLTALALLGLMQIPIDMGSSIVAAIAFGIVLDDSTHLMIRIRQLQQLGFDPSTAVVRSIRELAPPIVTTTLIVSCGFLVLFLAEIRVFHDFASVMIASMLTALVADLVILPVLVRSLVKDTLLEV